MAETAISLPRDFRLARLDTIDSTMSEAARRARAGEAGHMWVWALEQQQGRGRSGREWESRGGNLFTSLLLRPNCTIATALQLSLVAGIAAYDSVARVVV